MVEGGAGVGAEFSYVSSHFYDMEMRSLCQSDVSVEHLESVSGLEKRGPFQNKSTDQETCPAGEAVAFNSILLSCWCNEV